VHGPSGFVAPDHGGRLRHGQREGAIVIGMRRNCSMVWRLWPPACSMPARVLGRTCTRIDQ
jgi:hypothetical protein